MFLDQLQQFGLSKNQARVLDFLLENGEKKAVEVTWWTKQPRGVVYKSLEELIEKGLVEKIELPQMVARFRPVHPRQLEQLVQQQREQARKSLRLYDEILPSLTSTYNLATHRPGMKFYEGAEGLEKILDDTLKSKTDVLLFLNIDALMSEQEFLRINETYKKKRTREKVRKKVIRAGFPFEGSDSTDPLQHLTEIRYTKEKTMPFKSSIQIYDNKISYQIVDQGQIVSILIEDPHLYQMHKTMFELVWDGLKG